MNILPRSAWTDTAPGFSRGLDPNRVKFMALHYPGDGAVKREGLTQEQVATLLRAYRRYHVSGRGWKDIGYCYAVDQAGRAWTAAGDRVAAHSATKNCYDDANHEGIGVLLILGDHEAPTPAMIRTVAALRATLRKRFPGMRILWGHRQVPCASTQCPGDAAIALLARGAFEDGAASRDDDRDPIRWRPAVLPELINARLALAGITTAGGPGDYDRAAVAVYQGAQLFPGLLVDGLWGQVTESHFGWTSELQTKLNVVGGRTNVDGSYGAHTALTVGRFQAAAGLVVDEKAGPLTCAALKMRSHP